MAVQDRMAALLANLWQRNQPEVRARVDLLVQAAEALQANTLTPHQQEQATATAHKLAGTLGMYGYPQGTELARQLEALFDEDTLNPTQVATLTQSLKALLFPV